MAVITLHPASDSNFFTSAYESSNAESGVAGSVTLDGAMLLVRDTATATALITALSEVLVKMTMLECKLGEQQ